jgi:uncharacterized LabA/DUF88 family protein
MADRVVVFLDWQNVYRRGRAAFGTETEHHTYGQVDPLTLANDLCARKPGRQLKEVRIYRGIPTPSENPKGYAACRRQTAAWMNRGRDYTYVYLRPLQYLEGYDPREKGIDVQLAIDYVRMAVQDEYDVGILFSVDTDLNPAIEAVHELDCGAVPEVAAWSGPNAPRKRLGGTTSPATWVHWLDEQCFRSVADPVDYGTSK